MRRHAARWGPENRSIRMPGVTGLRSLRGPAEDCDGGEYLLRQWAALVLAVPDLELSVERLALSVWLRAAAFRCPDDLAETPDACPEPNFKRSTLNSKLQTSPLPLRPFIRKAAGDIHVNMARLAIFVSPQASRGAQMRGGKTINLTWHLPLIAGGFSGRRSGASQQNYETTDKTHDRRARFHAGRAHGAGRGL